MQALLPVFSFLAILLLVLIIPGQVKSHSIPAVSIISWLFVCNIIHAVNSIVWADNIGVHAPVWCDISTKILLGAMVAVPGALFCISRQLEVLTSRYEHTEKPSTLSKLIIDSIMCIVNPLLYMSLHTIVQFRRFGILENLGCQPAVHDSLPGVVLVWLPPFIISSLAFLYNCSAAFNLTKSHYNNVEYFPTAPDMQLSLFLRRLVFATIAVLYTAAAYAIVLSWSSDNLLPWTTISQVHANFAQAEIIQTSTRLATKSELIWWSIPAWTFLLCALSAFGEETKKGYRRIWAWVTGRSKKAVLPTVRPKRPQVLIPQANVSYLDLRSPWESTVRSDRTIKLKGSDSITSLSPTFPEDENSFTKSTLNYLDSDAARQLRLPSPPPETVLHYRNQTFSLPGSSSPPRMSPTQSSPTRASSARASPPPQTPPPRTPPPRTPPPQAPSVEFRPADPVDPEIMSTVREPIPRSRTSSILSTSAWPKPPPSPPSMHPYALSIPLQEQQQQQRQPPLRALSPAPSFSSGDVPFQGPSILDAPSGMPRRMVSTKSAKGKSRAGPSPIQLTVMRETLVDY